MPRVCLLPARLRPALARAFLVAGIVLAPLSVRAQWNPAGVALSVAANEQQLPAMVSDGSGGAIVTWQDARGSTKDIYARRVSDLGIAQWAPDGVAVSTAPGDQWEPKIISDGAGGAIITWYDYRGATADVYAQRVDAAGNPQWTANGVALSTAATDQVVPSIASDGAGGAIVAWHDYRNGAADIYAQRVNASGVPQWTTNGVAVCTSANNQAYPMIAADGAGGAIITWQDSRGANDDIYAQRMNSSGTPQWTANGVAICAAAGGQLNPVLVADGFGGAIVTWRDGRSGAKGIYAQLVNASGTPQWTMDGVPLSTVGTFQLFPTIVSDGAGGAIVTWQDNRNVTSYDVFARRVNAAGVPQWTANGVALCTVANDQSLPQIASDGAGGAIVTWNDVRSGTISDVYAQRVSAAGVPQWAADGILVSTSGSDKSSAVIVADSAGGAIVTWQDSRSDFSDIYAQRLNASGNTPTAAPEPTWAQAPLVTGLYPNPSRGTATLQLELPTRGAVRIEVFDIAGRNLRTMTLDDAVGSRRILFDGRNDRGKLLPSGVYLYRVTAQGTSDTRRMVITR